MDGDLGADEVIATLAAKQLGVVARHQLLAIEVGRRAIEHRVARGRLRPLHRGVYAVGHTAIPFRGRVIAALLATGGNRRPAIRERENHDRESPMATRLQGLAGDPVASHATAASLLGLSRQSSGAIHVTSCRDHARRKGLLLHRAALFSDEAVVVGGIPVTSAARTLLDLSAGHDSWSLRRLTKHAEFLHLTDLRALSDVLARHPGRKGRRALAEIVESGLIGAGRTRNDFEDRFLSIWRRHRLPPAEMNAPVEVAGRVLEIDAVWRRERVAVELDGFGAHGTRSAFEEDRARDRLLTVGGWAPIRVTWFQLERRPTALAAELRAILASRGRASLLPLR